MEVLSEIMEREREILNIIEELDQLLSNNKQENET
jgi:hypothetical protein